jgi:hypothetical protein
VALYLPLRQIGRQAPETRRKPVGQPWTPSAGPFSKPSIKYFFRRHRTRTKTRACTIAATTLVWPEKKIPLEPGGRVRTTPGDKRTNKRASRNQFILVERGIFLCLSYSKGKKRRCGLCRVRTDDFSVNSRVLLPAELRNQGRSCKVGSVLVLASKNECLFFGVQSSCVQETTPHATTYISLGSMRRS